MVKPLSFSVLTYLGPYKCLFKVPYTASFYFNAMDVTISSDKEYIFDSCTSTGLDTENI